MIVDLPATSTSQVSHKLVELSKEGLYSGARVLTLLIHIYTQENTQRAIEIARKTARKFPCRVIVVISGSDEGENRLDAEIRYGGKVGVSELVIFHLNGPLTHHSDSVVIPFLLPDIPIIAWWPGQGPDNPSADPIGRLAIRRITDTQQSSDSTTTFTRRLENYFPGDTDLSWPRITYIRALLTSAIDQLPHESLISAVVSGPANHSEIDLFAGWVYGKIGIPVERAVSDHFHTTVYRTDSSVIVSVDDTSTSISVSSAGYPQGRVAALEFDDADFLTEELRRLDPDEVYEIALGGLQGVKFVS